MRVLSLWEGKKFYLKYKALSCHLVCRGYTPNAVPHPFRGLHHDEDKFVREPKPLLSHCKEEDGFKKKLLSFAMALGIKKGMLGRLNWGE